MAFLLTHAHRDHFGGMETIVRAVPVGAFYGNGVPPCRSLMRALEERRIPVRVLRRDDRLDELTAPLRAPPGTGGRAPARTLSLEVLYPDREALASGGGQHRSTIVLRLIHGSLRFLLLGDSEWPEERRLIALEGEGLRADLLKIGHHGSPRSGRREFLEAVRPAVAVAQGTSFLDVPLFYPRPNYRIERVLGELGASLLTDRWDGVIQVISNGRSLETRSSRSRKPVPRLHQPGEVAVAQAGPGGL